MSEPEVQTTSTNGTPAVIVRDVNSTVIVPEIGDTVLIARELGTRALPRCLGIIQGREYLLGGEE